MPTHSFNAGVALNDRALAPILRRAEGLWKNSNFNVQLCQITQLNLAASVFLQTGGTSIPVFLFTQDAPTKVQAYSRYLSIVWPTDAAGTCPMPRLDLREDTHMLGDAGAAPMNTVLAAATVTNGAAGVGYGQVVAGNTLTNAIPVQGFPWAIALEDLSIQNVAPADITPEIFLEVTSRGSNIEGPISTGGLLAYNGAGTVDPQTLAVYPNRTAVILRQADYTAAMLAAGNIFVDGNGLVVEVVGLHAIPT